MALGCPLSTGLVAAGAALLSDEITSMVFYFVLKEKPVPPDCHSQGVASGSTWGLWQGLVPGSALEGGGRQHPGSGNTELSMVLGDGGDNGRRGGGGQAGGILSWRGLQGGFTYLKCRQLVSGSSFPRTQLKLLPSCIS